MSSHPDYFGFMFIITTYVRLWYLWNCLFGVQHSKASAQTSVSGGCGFVGRSATDILAAPLWHL